MCALVAGVTVVAQQLPVGIPRLVDTNGNTIFINHQFTSKAYKAEALRRVIEEANWVAKKLQLAEKLPIKQADLRESFISPFGFAYTFGEVGNITTSNYLYGVERDNKFSLLTIANYDQICANYRQNCWLPTNQINKAYAYQLATQWLASVSVDVQRLNKDCHLKVEIAPFWNEIRPGAELTKPKFVPIYDVAWLSPENEVEHRGDTAFVELFLPTKTILQLSVENSKYILSQPLVFTNLSTLFPGKALIITNHPAQTNTVRQPLSL